MPALMKYHGSKWAIAPWIINNMPSHRCYVEPFGGSAAVLLQKQPVLTEVYNDLNSEVYSVFKTIRENAEQLAEALALTPYSREDMLLAYEPTTEPVEHARRFLVRSQLAISTTSLNEKTGFRAHINSKDYCSQPKTWSKLPQVVFKVRDRLSRVIIENTDADNLFDRYDLPETLWYLDPPYPKETRSSASNRRGYNCDLNTEGHIKLLERVKGLKGKVMVSSYKNPLYDSSLNGWTTIERKGFTDSRNRKTSVEVLYLNFSPPQLLFD